jgi:hypothetical protein
VWVLVVLFGASLQVSTPVLLGFGLLKLDTKVEVRRALAQRTQQASRH